MVEENKTKIEKEIKDDIKVAQPQVPSEEGKEKKVDAKVEEKKEEKKPVVKKKEIVKKDVAIANGVALRISPKQSKYICRMIVRKSPEAAVARLQAVIDWKRPVPMAGLEVAHKKGKGLAGAKWPHTACRAIMEVVKQAGANAVVNGIEDPVIRIAKADGASAPLKKGGRKAKRAHIHIEVVEKIKLIKTPLDSRRHRTGRGKK